MKPQSICLTYVCVMLTLFSACKKEESTPLPTSFPRKQLIEQFTSQDCSYCPNGTNLIDEAISGRETQYVRLSYYCGNIYDDFTISTNVKVASALNISTMPSMLYNRAQWDWEEQTGVTASGKVMHPYYFSQFVSKAATTTTVSISINTAYDEATRMADITISGKNIGENQDINLVVMLKESGLHAVQQDSYNTWKGWADYVHNNVVRTYLNTYKGQTLEFDGINYKVSLDYELYKSYNADNCSVVAFLVDNNTGEVINAEETPLVSGTKGGSDFVSEGIKAVSVPESYPEVMAIPNSQANTQFLTAQYYLSNYTVNGNKVIEILMLSTNFYESQGSKYLPTATLYIVVDDDGSNLPIGTFQLSTSGEPGTAWAGQKIEEEFTYYGSEFILANYKDLNDGYINGFEWLLTSGSVTITDNSISFDATTLSGYHVTGSFSGQITHFTDDEMPIRKR